jgi:hypothetical protein
MSDDKRKTPDNEELRRLIEEGMQSGPSIDAEVAFLRLRAKFDSLARGRASSGRPGGAQL